MPNRVRRTLFAVSLAIACVIIVAWVLSYFRLDTLEYKFGRLVPPPTPQSPWQYSARTVQCSQFRGSINLSASEYLSVGDSPADLSPWNPWSGLSHQTVPPQHVRTFNLPHTYWQGWSDFALLSLGTYPSGRQGIEMQTVTIPHWMLAALPLSYLTWRTIAAFRARRRLHLCPHCSYDLRATPPGSPCPECGSLQPHKPLSDR